MYESPHYWKFVGTIIMRELSFYSSFPFGEYNLIHQVNCKVNIYSLWRSKQCGAVWPQRIWSYFGYVQESYCLPFMEHGSRCRTLHVGEMPFNCLFESFNTRGYGYPSSASRMGLIEYNWRTDIMTARSSTVNYNNKHNRHRITLFYQSLNHFAMELKMVSIKGIKWVRQYHWIINVNCIFDLVDDFNILVK